MCAIKTVKIFVIILPKDWWVAPCQFFFWHETEYRFVTWKLCRLYCIHVVSVIPAMTKILKDTSLNMKTDYMRS